MIKILMIEDDTEFSTLLTNFLSQYGIEVTSYEDPFLGLSAGIDKYDLLILDLTLPGMDGIEVCKEIVAKYDIPIIISSARSDISDKIIGLQIGADDYLPKPYDPKEMYARIISLLRRYKKTHTIKEPVYRLRMDENKEQIIFGDTPLELTPAEYEVLKLLIQNRGATVSKEQILYGSEVFNYGGDASLAVILNRLRNKLDDTVTIKTVRGVGYRLLT